MAERAHPEDPSFQDGWRIEWRCKGLIPWPRWSRSPWKQGMIARYQFCQPYATAKRVLDIPCGVGWGTSLLKRTRRLVGVDISPEAIDFARQRYGNQAEFRVGSMEKLNFGPGEFDLVICLEGIEHVPTEVGKGFLAEARRVLAPGGTIIVTSPLPDPTRPPNPYHAHEYELPEFRGLVSPYFREMTCDVRRLGSVDIVYYVGQVR